MGTLLWRARAAPRCSCAGSACCRGSPRTDPALTVLKARSADREPPRAARRRPRRNSAWTTGRCTLLGDWLGGLPRGDAGRSWISGGRGHARRRPALGASLLLMAVALDVALLVAAAGVRAAPCRRAAGAGRRRHRVGVLAALPEFLIASVLATVVGVQLGWLPALGWYGLQWTVLPAPRPRRARRGAARTAPRRPAARRLRRALGAGRGRPRPARPGASPARRCAAACPACCPTLGLFVVGLTGGAVAVEQIFDIPGLGRTALQAAIAQDLPVLQAGILALVLLAAVATGWHRGCAARLLIGPALRDGGPASLHRPAPPARRIPPLLYAGRAARRRPAGLPRDPLALDTARPAPTPLRGTPVRHGRTRPRRPRPRRPRRPRHAAPRRSRSAPQPSSSGCCSGCAPAVRTARRHRERDPARPRRAARRGRRGQRRLPPPALAVAAVAWAPLAAHTAALLRPGTGHPPRRRPPGPSAPTAGTSCATNSCPPSLPPVTRHALLRLPGIALALAALGFLGLGAQPPSPEWGLLLAENQPYAERAPWAVLAPAAVLALLGALAVTAAGLTVRRPRRKPARATQPRPETRELAFQ